MNKEEILKLYYSQYQLLEKRLIELSEYVTIHPSNYSTFSQQFISIFLSICSEIDSLLGEFCKIIQPDNKKTFTIADKIKIIIFEYPNLKNLRVQTKFPFETIDLVPFAKYKPNNKEEQEFSEWWWSDYNKVKHNRSEKTKNKRHNNQTEQSENGRQTEQSKNGRYNYQKANLKNVLNSMAALYVIIYKFKEYLNENMLIESNLFSDQITG